MPDALQLLREDHKKVQDMFKQFEAAKDERAKHRIAMDAIKELKIHAMIEEEIFYPAVRKADPQIDETMNEADEEHHVAEMIWEELLGMKPGDDRFSAKFTVLAENVKHHIREEESEILPKAAESGREMMAELGEKMQERKMELMQDAERLLKPATRDRRTTAGASRNGTPRRTTRTTPRRSTTGSRTASGTTARTTRSGAAPASRSTTRTRTRAASSRARSTGTSRSRSTGTRTRKATTGRSRSSR